MINAVEEIKEYPKSVIIFDLDSIAGLYKEYQSLTLDPEVASEKALAAGDNKCTFSYNLQRPQAFQTAIKFGNDAFSDYEASK
jgi:hypothetical protein